MKNVVAVACVLSLSACAKSAVIPLSADTVQITSSAAPVCGMTGAQSVAVRRAAIETINKGFDKFMIVGGGYQNDVRVVGYTPIQANTTSTVTATGYGGVATGYGQSQTTYSGGHPIVGGSHNQGLVVKMFRNDDLAGSNSISARDTLGPKWKEVIQGSANGTC
jgi:hypothetical protein